MAPRRLRLGAALALGLSLSLLAAPAAAQRAGAAVVPDTVTVGTIFHAAVRVVAPPGTEVVFPDSLDLSGDIEAAGRREIRVDTAAGGPSWTAIYPLAAWRPGAQVLPSIEVRVVGEDGERTALLDPGLVFVASVLPADTAGIDPQPPKGVVGGEGFPWLEAAGLLLLLLLLILLLFYLWRRWRARRDAVPAAPPLSPRERALADLAELRDSGGIDGPALYTRLSEVVRTYVQTLHPGLGLDLTTLELVTRARGVIEPEARDTLGRVLTDADLVKFARATRRHDQTRRDIERAADWVRDYPAPAPVSEEQAA